MWCWAIMQLNFFQHWVPPWYTESHPSHHLGRPLEKTQVVDGILRRFPWRF